MWNDEIVKWHECVSERERERSIWKPVFNALSVHACVCHCGKMKTTSDEGIFFILFFFFNRNIYKFKTSICVLFVVVCIIVVVAILLLYNWGKKNEKCDEYWPLVEMAGFAKTERKSGRERERDKQKIPFFKNRKIQERKMNPDELVYRFFVWLDLMGFFPLLLIHIKYALYRNKKYLYKKAKKKKNGPVAF